MQPTDLTIEILRRIRDEARLTNQRLDELRSDLGGRIDALTGLVDGTNERLERVERRQVESEGRLMTELVALGVTAREVRDALLEDRALRGQVADHERRLVAIETKPR